MTQIRPIENDRDISRAAPGLMHAQGFVRLRAEALMDAGVTRRNLAAHDLDDHNIVTAWAQKHKQAAALEDGSERFLGSFDVDGNLIGAVEVTPAADEFLQPYESPIDRVLKRRVVKPEANAVAIVALLANRGENQRDILIDLLRHTMDKYAASPTTIYFGVPGGTPAYRVALEEKFVPQNKFARRAGIWHALLARTMDSPLGNALDLQDQE